MTSEDREDELLAAVGKMLNQEREPLDPRLERLAHGELSAEEREALTTEAETNPDLARDVLLHEPISSPIRERLFEAAAERRRAPRHWRWAGGLGGLAAAAALALLMLRPSPAPLPQYEVSMRAPHAEWRGGSEPAVGSAPEVRSVRGDTEVTILFKPATPLEGEAEANLYALGPSGAQLSPVPPKESETGSVLWRGLARDLTGGRSGVVVLVAIVARPGAAPPADEVSAAHDRGLGWQAATVRLRVQSSGGAPPIP